MAQVTKNDLLKMDFTFMGEPFVQVEAKPLDTLNLDYTFMGEPFVAVTDSEVFPAYRMLMMF